MSIFNTLKLAKWGLLLFISLYHSGMSQSNEIELQMDNFLPEDITHEDLKKWDSYGLGDIALDHQQTILREVDGSLGFMLVSPEVYKKNTFVSYDVMALNAGTVLILEYFAHNTDDLNLEFQKNYNGNVEYLFKNVNMYMFAFHNAAHNKTGPFVRKFPEPGFQPLTKANQNFMHVGKYYHVAMGMLDGKLFFQLDGKTIWTIADDTPYQGGKIILRIRGTAHILAACSIKNLKIYRQK